MSRNRKRISNRAAYRMIRDGEGERVDSDTSDLVRFRVVCSCIEPKVVVAKFLAPRDSARRVSQLETGHHVLIGLGARMVEGGGYESRPKVPRPGMSVDWQCPKCSFTIRPTFLQAHTWAARLLDAGRDELDIRDVGGRRRPGPQR